MKIKLDKDYFLVSDERQYILRKVNGKGYTVIGYYTDIEDLLKNYLDYKGRTAKNITSVGQLLNYKKSLVSSLNKALKPLKIKISFEKEEKGD